MGEAGPTEHHGDVGRIHPDTTAGKGHMAITRRSDYAIRLMYELAQLPPGSRVCARDLCEAAGVPETFGSSLLPFLVDAELVKTSGYQDALFSLACPAREITMASIVRAAEPAFSLASAATGPLSTGERPPSKARALWHDLDRLVWERLASTTLSQLADDRPLSRRTYSVDATEVTAPPPRYS